MKQLNVITPDPTSGRKYITPTDVSKAILLGRKPVAIALDVLNVIGGQTEYGIEDASLCAFIAARNLDRL